MSYSSPILEADEFVMKKKILSLYEHYDFEDLHGVKRDEADGNLFQFPVEIHCHGYSWSRGYAFKGKVLTLRNQFPIYSPSAEELETIWRKIVKLIGEEF
jgi:uncharacterized protein YxjI